MACNNFVVRLVCGIAISLWFCGPARAAEDAPHGLKIDPPKKISRHTLIDQDERPAGFPADRWQLAFFGFTSCPDVCPVTLRKAAQVLKLLRDEPTVPRTTFISIDPDRDRPAVLKSFLTAHDAGIEGLTGRPGETQAVGREFEVVVRRYPSATGTSYRIEHSAFLYLLDPKGQVVMFFPATADAHTMANDIRRLISAAK